MSRIIIASITQLCSCIFFLLTGLIAIIDPTSISLVTIEITIVVAALFLSTFFFERSA